MSQTESTKVAAERFFRRYLDVVEGELSSFPVGDRQFFPEFSRGPHRVEVLHSYSGDLAFQVGRRSKAWGFRFVSTPGPVEERLDFPYSLGHSGFLFINTTRSLLRGLAFHFPLLRQPNPFIGGSIEIQKATGLAEFHGDCEVRFVDVAVSFGIRGRPQLVKSAFTWVLTGECAKGATLEQAARLGKYDSEQMMISLAFDVQPGQPSATGIELLIAALHKLIDEFRLLIERTDVEEEELQQYLKDHPFVLDPAAKEWRPKVNLGHLFQTDFVILYPDGGYRLVELEPAREQIVTGNDLSARALHAVRQVRDWQHWLTEHGDDWLGTPVAKHWVIIGKRHSLTPEQKQVLEVKSAQLGDIEVRGFDDLDSNFTSRATSQIAALGKLLRPKSTPP